MKETELAQKEFELGQSFAIQKQWEDAIACYKKVINIQPTFYEAYLHLGDAFRHQGNFNEAITIYEKLINAKHYEEDLIIDERSKKAINKVYSRFHRLLENSNISLTHVDKIQEIVENIFKNNPHNREVNKLLIYALTFSAEMKIAKAKSVCQELTYLNNLKMKPQFTKKDWQNGKKISEPNFMIIGFMKCATTSLYEYMVQHPQILPTSYKELMFFNNDRFFQMGIDWYLANFPLISSDSGCITGEASTLYVHYSKVAQRVKDFFPKIKLIVMLRNPVDRAISHYFFNKKLGHNLDKDMEDSINLGIKKIRKMKNISKQIDEKVDFISSGIYIYFLEKWMSIFPKEQFLILKTEDLAQDPSATLGKVFHFLDLPDYENKIYPKKNSGSYQPINDNLRQKLFEFYEPYNQKLEKYLGISFNWQ